MIRSLISFSYVHEEDFVLEKVQSTSIKKFNLWVGVV